MELVLPLPPIVCVCTLMIEGTHGGHMITLCITHSFSLSLKYGLTLFTAECGCQQAALELPGILQGLPPISPEERQDDRCTWPAFA